MPSPFPGMDPYLEGHWRDVHASLIIYTRDALQGTLPGPLRVRVEERIHQGTLQGFIDQPRRILELPLETSIAVEEPLVIETEPEPATATFLEIIDHDGSDRVVTVIEFLSPSSKSPDSNRERYIRKQREICSSDTNLVEIDLNRFGAHTLAFPLQHLKPRGRTPYMVCVRRVTKRGLAEVYPMPLWKHLPVVKIPLRPDDADVPLDLQALVQQCYRNGAYEGTLNYAVDPDPPLLGADKVWADRHLAEKGLRPQKPPPRKLKPGPSGES